MANKNQKQADVKDDSDLEIGAEHSEKPSGDDEESRDRMSDSDDRELEDEEREEEEDDSEPAQPK
jgi:hypothetical protein